MSLAQQGTIKEVELEGLQSLGDKKIPNIPAEAGLTVTLNIKSGKDIRSTGPELDGDENALESIEGFDAAGVRSDASFPSPGRAISSRA